MEVDGVSEILGACLVEKVDDDVADSECVGSPFTRPCRFSGTPTFDTCLYFEVPQVLASKMKVHGKWHVYIHRVLCIQPSSMKIIGIVLIIILSELLYIYIYINFFLYPI